MIRRLALLLRLHVALALALAGAAVTLLPAVAFAGPAPVASASASAAAAAAEEVMPDSPRASVSRFLDLGRRGDFEAAADLVEAPRGDKTPPRELARQLYIVLARFVTVDLEQISAQSAGKKDDRLPPGTDEIAKLRDRQGKLAPVRVARREAQGEREARWVFTSQTVATAREAYDGLEDRWLREHLPAVLLREGPKALLLWQWLAIPLLFFACLIVGRLLGTLTTSIAKAIAKRTKPTWDDKLADRLSGPVGLGWTLVVFVLALPRLALYLAAEELVLRFVHAVAFGTFFWALAKSTRVIAELVAESAKAKEKPSLAHLSDLGQRAARIAVYVIGVVAVVNELGYPVASLLTGLGIGGVALALAAQKTVENLFGSVSILADQPFKVGETVKVDGIEGTVETIGLRSTRIRTLDRTLVVIPNGKLADMRIEAFGARDRFRCALRIALDARTKRDVAEAVCAGLDARLRDHESVRGDDLAVRVKSWSEAALEIEAVAYVEAADFVQFARVRQELVLRATEAVAEAGAQLAPPPPPEARPAAPAVG